MKQKTSANFTLLSIGETAHPVAHTSQVARHAKGHYKPNESHHINKKVTE